MLGFACLFVLNDVRVGWSINPFLDSLHLSDPRVVVGFFGLWERREGEREKEGKREKGKRGKEEGDNYNPSRYV